MSDVVTHLLASLPDRPGVYQFFAVDDTLLYVGKAKSLASRVKSYFSTKTHPPRTAKLVEKIANIRWIETITEDEALVLETNLVKEHQPKFNVLLRDDKHFLYVLLTVGEYPVFTFTRRFIPGKGRYFGPYTDPTTARETIKVLEKLFHTQVCLAHPETDHTTAQHNREKHPLPCPLITPGLCPGPRLDTALAPLYAAWVQQAIQVLSGNASALITQLTADMLAAAKDRRYEYAALIKQHISALSTVEGKKLTSATDTDSRDVIGMVVDAEKAFLAILEIRNGKLTDQKNCTLTAQEQDSPALLASFLAQYYAATPALPPEIILPTAPHDESLVAAYLTRLAGHRVTLATPERGAKESLLRLAEKNAAAYRVQSRAAFERAAESTADLTALQDFLGMSTLPKRIECYDISHLQGSGTSGALSVLVGGKPDTSQYRHFRIRSLHQGAIDDYASLAEVLSRRMAYLTPQMPAGFAIRRAKKAEIPALIQAEHDRGILTPDWTDSSLTLVCAAPDGTIAGSIRLWHAGSKRLPVLQNLFIAEQHRGHRLGLALASRLMDAAKEKKYYLVCRPELREYYATLGFTETRIPVEDAFANFPHREDRISMVCEKKGTPTSDSLYSTPDLVVIDGGKGQLSSVLSAARFPKKTLVIGLAKKYETVIFPDGTEKILPPGSPACLLLTRVRDEAHRFSNRLRSSATSTANTLKSLLDDIPGIGADTRQILYKHFSTLDAIRAAEDADLIALIGSHKTSLIRTHLV